jgi:SAM-dependent methyltransferase
MDPIGLFPLLEPEPLAALFSDVAAALRAHRFNETVSLPHPGAPWHAFFDAGNLRRYLNGQTNSYEVSSVAPIFYRAFARKNPDVMPLFEAFAINRPFWRQSLERVMPAALVARLADLGVIVPTRAGGEDRWVSRLTATPVGPRIFFHDNSLIFEHEKPDHVFLGRCSTRLAERAVEAQAGRRFGRGLDLCTGSGVQAMTMSGACDEVVGGDVNPRALAYARANAQANGVKNATFVRSDLFTSIEGKFDIITANTPFLLLPEGSKALSGNGGHLGIELAVRLFEGLDAHLEPGGLSLVVASTVIIDGRNVFEEKLRGIFGGSGYEIDLFPINTYYMSALHDEYRKHGVEKCHLYIVESRKVGGSGLSLRVHEWPPLVELAYKIQMTRMRIEGWAASRRRASADLRG